ncbi:MAG: acyl-ACP--UDP-N-acetylglucosamine O-acyltransferase [Nitrospirae bacterium]|nr:acyl-ACP--UDP-N-acetylglucosamine O-acyltransferase [Nitrospirota bacterium]
MPSIIHPSAIVDPKAFIDEDVEIGPFCIIGKDVKIAHKTKLHSNVIIDGDTTIGSGCEIFQFTTIGLPPQCVQYRNEPTKVIIGNNNLIREYMSIHRASVNGDGTTTIGDNNYMMAYVHIAHDCKIGSNTILSNVASCAGHVQVGDFAVIGGLTAAHQFSRIGAYAMVGACSYVNQDIPPYTLASGTRTKLYGLNIVGLKRQGFSAEKISILKKAYRILFMDELKLKDALIKVETELPQIDEIKILIEFMKASKRGISQ